MKTKRVKMEIEIPATAEAILAGLDDLRAVHRPLAEAEQRVTDAEARLSTVKADVQATQAAADRLAGGVATGHAGAADLDAALLAQKAAALVVGPAEQAVREAEQRLAAERQRARVRFAAACRERLAALQREASTLAPILDALRDLEGALGRRYEAVLRDQYGAITGGDDLALGAVEWPSSLVDEGKLARAMVGAFASRGAA